VPLLAGRRGGTLSTAPRRMVRWRERVSVRASLL